MMPWKGPDRQRSGPPSQRTLFAGALVAVAILGDSYLYAVLPVYYAEAGISLLSVGLMLSANRWVRFLTNPLAGAIGSRMGWGVAFAGSVWLAAGTTAGYGLVRGVAALVVLRCLWGLSWSFLRLGGMAAVLAESPVGQRSRLMGLYTGIFRLGSAAGVAFGGYIADRLGYRETALALGAVTLVGAVVSTLPPALRGEWGAPGRGNAAASGGGGLTAHWIPRGRSEWAAALSGAALQMITSGLVTGTLGLLIRQRFGASVAVGPWAAGAATVTGLLLGSRFLIDLLLGPWMGHRADRRGKQRVLDGASGLVILGLAALLPGAGLPLVAAAAILLFAASTGAMAVLNGWAGDLAGREPGRFLPVYNTWIDLGSAVGPLLGYWLAERVGLRYAYLAGIGVMASAWLLRRALHRGTDVLPASTGGA